MTYNVEDYCPIDGEKLIVVHQHDYCRECGYVQPCCQGAPQSGDAECRLERD